MTVHANDMNADRPVYVFWQGQTRRVLRAVKAPQVSLAPSSVVPPAIFVSAPAPRRGPVEASTPLYLPRQHEDQALQTSNEESYFTPMRGPSRFEPYPPTEKRRKAEPAMRSSMRELNELREKSRLHRSVPKPLITNDVHFHDLNRIENADAYYGGFAHAEEAGQTRARGVKQSVSFIPPTRVREDRAAYANTKQRSAGTETRKETREVGRLELAAAGNAGQSSAVAHVVSGLRDAVRPNATRGRRKKKGSSASYEGHDAKQGATELYVARGGDKTPDEIRRG